MTRSQVARLAPRLTAPRVIAALFAAGLLLAGSAVALRPSLAFATGFGGDAPPSRIPVPARDFSASVTDAGGTEVKVTRVTWNGEVFVYGNLGAAQVTVPFESIASLRSLPHDDPKKRKVEVTMTDATVVTLTVDHDLPCYGLTTYGNYRIDAEDLGTVRFSGLTVKP